MRDRRGPVARATGLAESVAAAVRRRQQSRLPRVVLQDHAGEPRLLRPDSALHDEMLATAEALVDLVLEEVPAPDDVPEEPEDGLPRRESVR